jgi:hypothetical protein
MALNWIYKSEFTSQGIREFLKEANKKLPCFLEEESLDYENYLAVNYLVKHFSLSDKYEDVFLKVHLINSVYSTRIMNPNRAAKDLFNRIKKMKFQERLDSGDPSLVDALKKFELSDKRIEDKRYNLLSFTSKYCHCHKPDLYPIYDRYVYYGIKQILRNNKKKIKEVAKLKFKDVESSYTTYKLAVDLVITKVIKSNGEILTYPEFDRFLWVIGRAYASKIKCNCEIHRARKNQMFMLRQVDSFEIKEPNVLVNCPLSNKKVKWPLDDKIRYLKYFERKLIN